MRFTTTANILLATALVRGAAIPAGPINNNNKVPQTGGNPFAPATNNDPFDISQGRGRFDDNDDWDDRFENELFDDGDDQFDDRRRAFRIKFRSTLKQRGDFDDDFHDEDDDDDNSPAAIEAELQRDRLEDEADIAEDARERQELERLRQAQGVAPADIAAELEREKLEDDREAEENRRERERKEQWLQSLRQGQPAQKKRRDEDDTPEESAKEREEDAREAAKDAAEDEKERAEDAEEARLKSEFLDRLRQGNAGAPQAAKKAKGKRFNLGDVFDDAGEAINNAHDEAGERADKFAQLFSGKKARRAY
ncbi:hypothetical protein MPH_01208 [Macrophomina phaseolina MS6]|uniref:Uncharacterized protein n=1 Tax=Macrophomina phaseolina (strain MS6) TaxID=1126212 RepID=K2S9C9_MACPH|nr:hypothetical protein MPH_01208 [Macrophomina phaseolina MS6]